MTKDEALKLALEALERVAIVGEDCGILSPSLEDAVGEAIDSAKEALAQPEQDAVAKYIGEGNEGSLVQLYNDVKKGTDFYTTPPQRQPLTDERIELIWQFSHDEEGNPDHHGFARGLEAEHNIKEQPARPEQPDERNFCPRCGKLTKDIHTCTPPG